MSSTAAAGALCAGIWFEKGKSRAQDAMLSRHDDGRLFVRAKHGSALAWGTLDDVDVSARIGNIPRTITFTDGSVFETLDNDAIDALDIRAKGRRAGLIHKLERFHPRLIVIVAVAAVLLAGIYRFGLPVLVEVAVLVTPPIIPDLMSDGTMRSLDRTVFSPSQLPAERTAVLHDGFERLALQSRHLPEHYTLLFRDAPTIGPNAFALPDGTIVITDQLVALAPNDETVIAVIGHEIGHVEMQHSLRQFYRTAGIAAMIMLVTGDIGPIVEDALVQGTLLLQLSYSRGAELEADRRSVELMHAAGFNPAAMGGFFALLANRFGDTAERTNYLSTHPATPARRSAVERYADQISGGDP